MKILVCNWKAHPASADEAVLLAKASDFGSVVICPPHQFLDDIKPLLQHAVLGAQDYAPDVQLQGVSYVIIGHSDRRKDGETDDVIAEKVALAAVDGLTPILCIGETKEERGRGKKEAVLRDQLMIGLSRLKLVNYDVNNFNLVIAYEPVWAISTALESESASPEDALRAIAFLKEQLVHLNFKIPRVFYLYGGSVSSRNIQAFIQHKEIDGALVGAASLNPKEIKKIWQIIQTE